MLNISSSPLKVAIAQVAPVFLDRAASLDLACELVEEAANGKAELIVFPEAFLPGFPDWILAAPVGGQNQLNQLYFQLLANAVSIPSPTTDKLCRVARRNRICLVTGLVEDGGTACYNSLLFINNQGQIVGKRRQLILNEAERSILAAGDGSTLVTPQFHFGRVGGVISGENFMPLLRYAIYSLGAQLYIATLSQPDPGWFATLQHIAREGSIYVIASGRAFSRPKLPPELDFSIKAPEGEWLHPGGSAVIDPAGAIIAGPFWETYGLFYAELEPNLLVSPGRKLNLSGAEARPDVFELRIDQTPRQVIRWGQEGGKMEQKPENFLTTGPLRPTAGGL